MAIKAEIDPTVYTESEVIENCTVEIWRDPKTGKESVGWKRRPEGRWEYIKSEWYDDFILCSECGEEITIDGAIREMNYCPNCGAKMKNGRSGRQ